MSGKFFEVAANRATDVVVTESRQRSFASSCLEVRMFHVGEGEAVLVIFPDKRTWLVDGGCSRNPALGKGLAAYLASRTLVLDALIPSHPHVDHAGAIATLLDEKPAMSSRLKYYRSEDPTWHLKERVWLGKHEHALGKLGTQLAEVALRNAEHDVAIGDNVRAHFFAGQDADDYTSLFLQLHFGKARLLFTGDAHCPYEDQLMSRFKKKSVRADVLKVTHHGSSNGTSASLVRAIKPGIAIASTANEDGHRLEKDTLKRLKALPGRREIRETVLDGDIVLKTDGRAFDRGVLYHLECFSPGEFAKRLGAEIARPSQLKRESKNDPKCK